MEEHNFIEDIKALGAVAQVIGILALWIIVPLTVLFLARGVVHFLIY